MCKRLTSLEEPMELSDTSRPPGSGARPWPREGGEALRHLAGDAASSDCHGPLPQVLLVPRDQRTAELDHEMADVPNGDAQPRAAFAPEREEDVCGQANDQGSQQELLSHLRQREWRF